MHNDAIKVVCLGDSITWGFPYGPEYSWVKMLADVLKGEVINQGINGNTTSDMLARFNRAVINAKPTHVIIMGGANDVICQESFEQIVFNIQSMTEKALENGIKVIMGTPPPIDEPEPERRLKRIREWIINHARMKHLAIIDFAAAFFDSSGNIRLEYLLADGAHPSSKGYQALFAQIDLKIFI
ncbi:MAG: GDSL-type esterase/lipase family protein [Syntrophomonas sp.]|nr:GDSL-type esterase/lipase family protein [Syntrophomonas sp.]